MSDDGLPLSFDDSHEHDPRDSSDTEQEILAAHVVIEAISGEKNVRPETLTLLFQSLAAIDGHVQRELLIDEARKALKGRLSKDVIRSEVNTRRIALAEDRHKAERQAHEDALSQLPVNAGQLINDLELFFAERAFLPPGAALLLAYISLNTWTFNVFDTVPYLSLESAVPGCGKSTVIRLLEAVSCRARKATSLTEAVMFRLIDAESPTLLIDEAETIEGRAERAEALRAIAHEGYKKGGQVARCEGDDHKLRWFDVFCPKIFAAIGGLTGALLDRCLVIHMEKAPKNSIRKSTRNRALRRDAKRLLELLEAYGLQTSEALRKLYESEPDCGYWSSIMDRESELWGPLLLHAKLAGPEAERKLLAVVEMFGTQKAEILAADWRIAQTIELLDVITKHTEETFTPGDLVATLTGYETWARTFAEVKGRDDSSVQIAKAAKVGYALRKFRLRSWKNSYGHRTYERQAAIDCLAAHVPENPPNPPKPPTTKPPYSQVAEHNGIPEGTESTEGLSHGQDDAPGAPPVASTPSPKTPRSTKKPWSDGLCCPGCAGTFGSPAYLAEHLPTCKPFDIGAMTLAEVRPRRGLKIDPELQARYEAYLQLGMGPLSPGVC
jgi:hypothetical protein